MADERLIDTLLLLALPASGKSEVRRYMLHVPWDDRVNLFHIGDTVQLDDFPYVHFMRVVDEGLEALGQERHFYLGPHDRFKHLIDWGTLLHLVNEDYTWLRDTSIPSPEPTAAVLFERLDRARKSVGGPTFFEGLDAGLRDQLAERLEGEALRLNKELFSGRPDSLEGKTIVIEFARGGPEGADMPLSEPHGYGWNLAQLSDDILSRSDVLYVWVTPEESRRKNIARCDPNDPGSILHHSAPESVMFGDYGCDDVDWLMDNAKQADTIEVEAHGKTYALPIGRFDNRVDKTTFVHDDESEWKDEDAKALHNGLTSAFEKLWGAHKVVK